MLVLTHVGSDIPDYAKHMWKQVRDMNPDLEIVMLANNAAIQKDAGEMWKYNIQSHPTEDLQDDDMLMEFNRLSWYKNFDRPNTTYRSPDNFVQGTSERLFTLAAFIKQKQLSNVFHCENDIMIYCDLEAVTKKCKKLYKMFVTPMSHIDITCAMMYIPAYGFLKDANSFMLEQLERGDQAIRGEFGMPMVHEMSLLQEYSKKYPASMGFFPTMPGDTNHFGMLFDPASYGQNIGGTNCGHGPGFTDPIHYIGKKISEGKINAFIRAGMPYVQDIETGEIFNIANLHIHSKQLEGFLTHELSSV